MERTIRRGDIFMADLNPIIGSEQGGIRPVLILSNNLGNTHGRLQAEGIKRRGFLRMHKFLCSAISPRIPSSCLSKYAFWISSVCKPD